MLFTVKKIDNWCVHASTGTKIYIAEQLYLRGGVEFGLTETCSSSPGSGQKHKLKPVSQYLHVATAIIILNAAVKQIILQ